MDGAVDAEDMGTCPPLHTTHLPPTTYHGATPPHTAYTHTPLHLPHHHPNACSTPRLCHTYAACAARHLPHLSSTTYSPATPTCYLPPPLRAATHRHSWLDWNSALAMGDAIRRVALAPQLRVRAVFSPRVSASVPRTVFLTVAVYFCTFTHMPRLARAALRATCYLLRADEHARAVTTPLLDAANCCACYGSDYTAHNTFRYLHLSFLYAHYLRAATTRPAHL